MSGLGADEAAAWPGGPVYVLGSSPAERDRLRRQSAELAGHSARILERGWPASGNWRSWTGPPGSTSTTRTR